MISFANLSSLIRAFFALWALLLCVINILNAVLAFDKKKYIFGSLEIILFLLNYFLWQVMFDYSLSLSNGSINIVSQVVVDFAWIYWLISFIVLTILGFVLLFFNIRYEKNYLTVNSIKTYLDKIECGVCYYKDNGRVIFSNMKMNQLSNRLIGIDLLNGNQFHDATKEEIVCVDEERWKFTTRDIVIGNENLHEIIAMNVTSEYLITQQLEKDKIELSKIKQELQDYNLSIDEVVRHQEILQAKINIHDEMNRLMLSTVAYENEDISNLNKIFALWQENASLLFMEAKQNKKEVMERKIIDLANALKMRLVFKDEPITILNEEERNIFYIAAQEAIANANKHAHADRMIISIIKNKDNIECRFINNGELPNKEITFTGGLANLEKLIKKNYASIKVNIDHQFALSLIFLNKNNPNG